MRVHQLLCRNDWYVHRSKRKRVIYDSLAFIYYMIIVRLLLLQIVIFTFICLVIVSFCAHAVRKYIFQALSMPVQVMQTALARVALL